MQVVTDAELVLFGAWLVKNGQQRLDYCNRKPDRGVRSGSEKVTLAKLTRWGRNWLTEVGQENIESRSTLLATRVWAKVQADGDFPEPEPLR